MSEESGQIECSEHGSSSAAFVCSHLLAEPAQRWHSNRATDDDPCPDAWCERCEALFQREGEWNENNSHLVEIKLICRGCYESRLGESVKRLDGESLAAWQAFLETCHAELEVKQDALRQDYALARHKRWDWYQERAEIIFSSDGAPGLIADIDFVGSISTKSKTWLWSWANATVLDSVRCRMVAVYRLGSEQDYPHLTVPKWKATEADGWDMSAIAAHVLNAAGVYRTPDETGLTFLLLRNPRLAQ